MDPGELGKLQRKTVRWTTGAISQTHGFFHSRGAKKKFRRVKNAVFSCTSCSKEEDKDVGSPPSVRKPRRTRSGHKVEPSQTFPPENLPTSTTSLEVQDAKVQDAKNQEDTEEGTCPMETLSAFPTSLKVQDAKVQAAENPEENENPDKPQSLPEAHGPDPEEGFSPVETVSAIPVSTDAELPLVSKTSHDPDLGETEEIPAPQETDTPPSQKVTLIQVRPIRSEDTNSVEEQHSTIDEEIDVPILSEQSQFSIEERNDWVHKMCQKFASLSPELRDHMAKTAAQRHMLSILEHCFESDEHECIDFLGNIVKSPKCNLDVVIRFLYDKTNEGSWLPEAGEKKLRVKVKAARYLISVIKWVCDPKKLMFWYVLLTSTYMNIWNEQPRQSEEDSEKNKDTYLHPGEIIHIIGIMKDMQQKYMSQILPDVAD